VRFFAPMLMTSAILAGCAVSTSTEGPPSDAMLIMRTAGMAEGLHDAAPRIAPVQSIDAGNGLNLLSAATNTGLSAAFPTQGLTSLGSGLFAGINLLTSVRIIPASLSWLLIWAPETEGSSPAEIGARYANTFAAAWANALNAQVPTGRFAPHPIAQAEIGTGKAVAATIEMQDLYCYSPGISCWLMVVPPTETKVPSNPPQLPERLVGFSGRQTAIALDISIGLFNENHFPKTHTSAWPLLETLLEASRALPQYAWIYVGPGLVTYRSPSGLKFIYQPVLINQGHLVPFVTPTAAPSTAGTETQPGKV